MASRRIDIVKLSLLFCFDLVEEMCLKIIYFYSHSMYYTRLSEKNK